MDNIEPEFDFWTERLNISKGSYNSAVDDQIYAVAKMIWDARQDGNRSVYCTDIAEKLGISEEHAELIQYILGSITMPVPEGKPHYAECFTYGTSPRGLFVDDEDMCKQFLTEYETYINNHWRKPEATVGE